MTILPVRRGNTRDAPAYRRIAKQGDNLKMKDLTYEISRTPPDGKIPRIFLGGKPILYAYGCALLERETDKGYVYTAINLETNKTAVIRRSVNPLSPQSVNSAVERMRLSNVAGVGRLEAEHLRGKQVTPEKVGEILDKIFLEILPKHGYTIREEQSSLSRHILDTIINRCVTLAEAEVGIGKTLAYLLPAILAKRGRVNDFDNRALYPKMQYSDMRNMPIVIATSSIALQKAILTDYIPALSKILTTHGIIRTPITAVLRKGRSHYVCERKLRTFLDCEKNKQMQNRLRRLLAPNAPIDLAEIEGFDEYTKRKISVPEKCTMGCPHRDACAYWQLRENAGNPSIDIQIVNHNYLLADTVRRSTEGTPLIPNYQMLIIDEAHKFLSAARSMYGVELTSAALPQICETINNLSFIRESAQRIAYMKTRRLLEVNRKLFTSLNEMSVTDAEDDAVRLPAVIDGDGERQLRTLRDVADSLHELLTIERVTSGSGGKKSDALWRLYDVADQLAALACPDDHICWIEKPTDTAMKLCAIPKDIDARLFNDQWRRGIPTILTSGTLSAGGDFTHIKKQLGLEPLRRRLTETSHPSPFDHRENSLLYISNTMPFPDQKNPDYIVALADEIEKLLRASHGHAAILFTSYDVMGRVFALLTARLLPFPFFKLGKGSSREIERFKSSGNGVLFASGAMWEGIDIPGDTLSMLIIAKLPFPVPDPIGEYERTLYDSNAEYRRCVIEPDMQVRFKQGYGRNLRCESDTGVVAVCDIRAAEDMPYHNCVLQAVPDCRVTSDIEDVIGFFDEKKTMEYFK